VRISRTHNPGLDIPRKLRINQAINVQNIYTSRMTHSPNLSPWDKIRILELELRTAREEISGLEHELANSSDRIGDLEKENAALREALRQSAGQVTLPKKTLKLPDPVQDRGKYELWKDRTNKHEKPLEFLRRVWGAYIDSGVMYQIDLKGQQRTPTNQNPKKPLDKTLFDAVSKQCKDEGKDLNDHLPNKSKQVDRKLAELEEQGIDLDEIFGVWATRRTRIVRKSRSINLN
jgi:hypothetical protein